MSSAGRMKIERHLAECPDCLKLKEEFEELVTRLRNDSAFEPPAGLVQWGVNLFQPAVQPAGGKLRTVIASLIYDTYDQPLLAGVRRVSTPPRQRLYRADDVDVDVKIESVEGHDRVTLVGQVLSSGATFFDNTPVRLESQGVIRYRTTTNVVGEFSFDEVPKDTYHLSVDLPQGQITLFCVHRANF